MKNATPQKGVASMRFIKDHHLQAKRNEDDER